jgi:hypothetical protein
MAIIDHCSGKGRTLATVSRESDMDMIGVWTMAMVGTRTATLCTPDLAVPDHMVQSQFSGILDKKFE